MWLFLNKLSPPARPMKPQNAAVAVFVTGFALAGASP